MQWLGNICVMTGYYIFTFVHPYHTVDEAVAFK